MLVRRSLTTPSDLAFFYCHAPQDLPVSLPVLIKVAGKRWPVEECLQQGQTGLDQHQVRTWHCFHRHTVLSMCSQALLAIAAARPAPLLTDAENADEGGIHDADRESGESGCLAGDVSAGSARCRDAAVTVTAELATDGRTADTVRAAHAQHAQNAADTAGRRYLAVDPANRLVAGNLEADWNTRLRELAQARDDYARARDADAALDEQQQARVLALAEDFPALWNDPATPMRERKRLLRLLITDVTLASPPRSRLSAPPSN